MNNYERGRYEANREGAIALMKLHDRYSAKLKASGNYVANKEVNPTKVTFANGRVVRIVKGALVVEWRKP